MAKAKCRKKGCDEEVYARGLCRRHYQRDYSRKRRESAKKSGTTPAQVSRMSALEREYASAMHCYNNVTGFTGRLKWAAELSRIRKEMEEENGERKSRPSVTQAGKVETPDSREEEKVKKAQRKGKKKK